MAAKLRAVLNALLLISICGLCSCASPQGGGKGVDEAVNVMGDWQGSQMLNYHTKSPLVAQVIALGDGKFQANLLPQFDTRAEPLAVLEGKMIGRTVYFTEPNQPAGGIRWEGIIERGEFSGSFRGAKWGSFMMTKTARLSPSLEAKPPAGAIVLFDGTNLDRWEPGEPLGLVGIYNILGKSKAAVAYIRCEVYSEKEQQVNLSIGSDDGVKAWLNGQLVHSNNVIRMWRPDEDREWVTLEQGWNTLMLKVTTKGGPWGASARFVDDKGGTLYNVWEKDIYSVEGNQTRKYLDKNGNFLTVWKISGPYKQQGKDANSLFDIAFAPEEGEGAGATWRVIGREYFEQKMVKWKVIDGAMEVGSGTGSIVSRLRFINFKLHMEFRTPFMPEVRGQKRGNSGVYLQGRYEVQILDSYGLKGENNQCGAIYEVAAPLVNMCAPPLQWQSYDITFCAPRFDESGKKIKDAHITVVQNGVKVQDNVAVSGPTAYPLDFKVNEGGGILLQDHSDSVQYRNIWVVELPEGSCN